MPAKKLHERFLDELELVHLQLDELRANVKDGNQEMWLWLASYVKTKSILVMQVGGRNQEMAFSFVKVRLASGCVPVFITDVLKHYFYRCWLDQQLIPQLQNRQPPPNLHS